MWRGRVGCPGVAPAPGAGSLLGPARTSSMEQVCLVWVEAVFPRLQMRQHSHISRLRLFLQQCLRCAWCYLRALGHGLGAGGCFDFLFFFLFFLWGWQLPVTLKMRARKCRSHGCCGEGGRQRCRGSAACPRAFCRLAHAALPWLIPAGQEPAAGTGWGEQGRPSRCCQLPPWLAEGDRRPLCSHLSPQAPRNHRLLLPDIQGAMPRAEQWPGP